MSSFYKLLLLGNLVLLTFAAYSQDISEVPLGALPMQYNGSFAGEAGSPRISSNFGFGYRSGFRWGGYYRGSYEQQVAYDQFVPALSTGIGVGVRTAQYDLYSNPTYTLNLGGLSVAIAPKISINGKYTLSPSLSLAYDAWRMPTRTVIINDTPVVDYGNKSSHLLGRAGLLFNTSKFYVGYSVNIVDFRTIRYVDRPRESRRMDWFSSYLQLGYTFEKSPESNFSVTPQLAFYIGQQQYSRPGIPNRFRLYLFQGFNLNFRYKRVIWGVNNTGLHAGWQGRRLKVMVSNAINFEGDLNWHHFGNLSVRYVFRDEKR